MAKAGGLGDVVGSLPKYLNIEGVESMVVMPKYDNSWVQDNQFQEIFSGEFNYWGELTKYSVWLLKSADLGFPLFMIDIPGRFDRPGIYIDPQTGNAYWDEKERFISFQIAVLEWLKDREEIPDIIHCHDHHTGLIPFMVSQCNRYRKLANTPTVITVHNAEYQGIYSKESYTMLPVFNVDNIGLLEWDGVLNSLAAGLKTAWKITTVSKNYMKELKEETSGLEKLFKMEQAKSTGIINGIDTEIWNPETDKLLAHNFSFRSRKNGKAKNRKVLCDEFGLNPEAPIVSFIGRLVREKGADLLPDLIKRFAESDREVNFVLLGTGDPKLHEIFTKMANNHVGFFDATLEYNEWLAHQMYAGSDFILMPSRVEPCGLNQLFAMRYGAIPIVRATGGLKDTVIDISTENGYGIRFNDFNIEDAESAIKRAIDLYENQPLFNQVRSHIMKLDFSWNRSAKEYIQLYNELKKKAGK